MNIYDYFAEQLGREPDEPSLRDIICEDECGRRCKAAIDAMKAYLAAIEGAHPDAIDLAFESVNTAIENFWLG